MTSVDFCVAHCTSTWYGGSNELPAIVARNCLSKLTADFKTVCVRVCVCVYLHAGMPGGILQ